MELPKWIKTRGKRLRRNRPPGLLSLRVAPCRVAAGNRQLSDQHRSRGRNPSHLVEMCAMPTSAHLSLQVQFARTVPAGFVQALPVCVCRAHVRGAPRRCVHAPIWCVFRAGRAPRRWTRAGIDLAWDGSRSRSGAPMSTFASTLCRRLARLAWAFLYLLASQPAHRYPWFARPGKIRGQSTFSDR